ncbi:MAG TPA: GNAT family N-acetyltransferase [Pirellulaceae bacterium]|nr:GNAT family N-acetyltransferase [Pirellulaceae bacterium]
MARDGTPLSIRDAVDADLPRIVEIYNQSIAGGWSTADTRPVTVESRAAWFAERDPNRRPIWVAEVAASSSETDGPAGGDSPPLLVVGWISLTSFYRGRPAYDATAEISVYIAGAWQRLGIGRQLKEAMIARCPALGVTTLVSMHFDHNPATERLNQEFGFVRAGYLEEIALVQGQKRGLVLSLLRIPPGESGGG